MSDDSLNHSFYKRMPVVTRIQMDELIADIIRQHQPAPLQEAKLTCDAQHNLQLNGIPIRAVFGDDIERLFSLMGDGELVPGRELPQASEFDSHIASHDDGKSPANLQRREISVVDYSREKISNALECANLFVLKHCHQPKAVEVIQAINAGRDALRTTKPVSGGAANWETDYWLIFFEEVGKPCETFTDEAGARHRHKRLLDNWNCHLFRRVEAA